jgi:hypothetical protein
MEVLGPKCNEHSGTSPPRARKPRPQSSALRLCRPPLRFALSTSAVALVRGVGILLSLRVLPPPSPLHKKQQPIQGGSNDEQESNHYR